MAIIITAFGLNWGFAHSVNPQLKLHYQIGEELFVVANSGLKLRTESDFGAKVITIMDFGEEVQVLNDSVHWASYERVDWIDGHWIYVEYAGVKGYAFDGFLSSFPMPFFGYDAVSCEDLPILLESYLSDMASDGYIRGDTNNYIESMVGENTFGVSRSFPGNHHMTFLKTEDETRTTLSISGIRMSEALHVMMNLLDYCPERNDIVEDLVYWEDQYGKIIRIQSKSLDRLKISLQEDDTIMIRYNSPCQVIEEAIVERS